MVKSELIPYLSYKEMFTVALLNKEAYDFLFDKKEEQYIKHIINTKEKNRLK